jgi:hypothetical protein
MLGKHHLVEVKPTLGCVIISAHPSLGAETVSGVYERDYEYTHNGKPLWTRRGSQVRVWWESGLWKVSNPKDIPIYICPSYASVPPTTGWRSAGIIDDRIQTRRAIYEQLGAGLDRIFRGSTTRNTTNNVGLNDTVWHVAPPGDAKRVSVHTQRHNTGVNPPRIPRSDIFHLQTAAVTLTSPLPSQSADSLSNMSVLENFARSLPTTATERSNSHMSRPLRRLFTKTFSHSSHTDPSRVDRGFSSSRGRSGHQPFSGTRHHSRSHSLLSRPSQRKISKQSSHQRSISFGHDIFPNGPKSRPASRLRVEREHEMDSHRSIPKSTNSEVFTLSNTLTHELTSLQMDGVTSLKRTLSANPGSYHHVDSLPSIKVNQNKIGSEHMDDYLRYLLPSPVRVVFVDEDSKTPRGTT